MAAESLKNNPFAGLGTIVQGDRFVGRNDELNSIRQRVLGRHDYSNIAIVGLPRIGKSSLVYECIMSKRESLLEDNTIPIYYSISSLRNSFDFFKKLVLSIDDKFQDESLKNDERYSNFAKPIVSEIEELPKTKIDDLYDKVEKYLKKLKRWEYKVIVILDEFDNAKNIFQLADFQLLRDLSYEPDTKLCLITCSRQTLKEIEKGATDGNLSNFEGIFTTCNLKTFEEQDVQKYWERVEPVFQTSDEYKKLVRFLVGTHPWLMDIVNDYYYSKEGANPNNVEILEEVKLNLMKNLDDMISILEKEDLFNSALQLVIGPLFHVPSIHQEKLLKYGFIRRVPVEYKNILFKQNIIGPQQDNYAYVCFSDFSTLDLYRRYYTDIPYLEYWGETERTLRSLIVTYLNERYTDNWEEEMKQYIKDNPPFPNYSIERWSDNVSKLKANKKNMVSVFPEMQEQHITDFSLTSQLFDIFIKCDWNWFGAVFKGEKRKWNEKFDYITKIRNVLVHYNNDNIVKTVIDQARSYCNDINQAISNWINERI